MIAAEADGLGRVLPGGAPAKEPAEAGAIGEAAVLVPAADAPSAILAVEAEPEAAEPASLLCLAAALLLLAEPLQLLLKALRLLLPRRGGDARARGAAHRNHAGARLSSCDNRCRHGLGRCNRHCNQAFGRLHDLGSHHAPPALGRVAVRWLSRCRRQSGRDDHRRAARLPAWRLERRDDSRQIGDFHVHALNPTQILAQILNFVW